MANLRFPADIETEILLRLPVKSLKRFQCVSKPWRSLISSSQFQRSYFRRAQKRPPLLLTIRHEKPDSTFDNRLSAYRKRASRNNLCSSDWYKSSGWDPFTIRFSTYNQEGSLINNFSTTFSQPIFSEYMVSETFKQSCLGFVLLASQFYSPFIMVVCNPSTEEVISLPYRDGQNLCVGLGYTPSTQQFKVIRFFEGKDNQNLCEVFTLGTSNWRKARTPPFNVYRGIAPFLHGAFHFMPLLFYRDVHPSDYIAAFNIETEEYNNGIRLPDYYYTLGGHPHIASPNNLTRLTKLGGSLCLTFDFGEMAGRLEMWILKDYDKVEWARGHTIDISGVCHYPSNCLWAYPVEDMCEGSMLLNVSDSEGNKVLKYDPQDEVVTLKIRKETAAAFYVESLYTLQGQVNGSLARKAIRDGFCPFKLADLCYYTEMVSATMMKYL